MTIKKEAKLLKIIIGDSDKIGHSPVYEHIVRQAKKQGLAGATVYSGIMGFGRASRIHTSKILRLSEDLPLIIEIIDELEKIEAFMPFLDEVFENGKCGGLITLEDVKVIKYTHGEKSAHDNR